MKHSFVTVESSEDEVDFKDSQKPMPLSRFVAIGSPSDSKEFAMGHADAEMRPRSILSDSLLDASHRSKLLTDDNCVDMKMNMVEIEDSGDSSSVINISEINSSSVTGTGGNGSHVSDNSHNIMNNKNNSNNKDMGVKEAKLLDLGQNYTYFPWHSVSPLVFFGYRTNYSFKQILLSIVAVDPKNQFGIIHNEFINIWTEILPGVFYLFLYFQWISANYNEFIYKFNVLTQIIIFLGLPVYGIRALVSAYAHSMHCYSEHHHYFSWNCDYSSISLTVFAS